MKSLNRLKRNLLKQKNQRNLMVLFDPLRVVLVGQTVK